MRIRPMKQFMRALTPPPDKSITIRAAVMGWLASGKTTIVNPLISGDTVSAFDAVAALGAEIEVKNGAFVITGGRSIDGNVDAGNSATTLRLLAGATVGKDKTVTFTGDESLKRRDMGAVIDVLRRMGADITGKNCRLPITVKGAALNGIDFCPDKPSAQVKGAVLLAGLNAEGRTTVTEEIRTRTHTEDMLALFGADIKVEGGRIELYKSKLSGTLIDVPGDMSSAAYPIALALNKGYCYLKNVGLARRELIDFLVSIGGDIEVESKGDRADITVKKSTLAPFTISGALSAALIDELPLLAVLACFTGGKCVIKDAGGLKNKECDRIKCTVANLRGMGAEIEALPDGFMIAGTGIKGGNAHSYGDHRIAMSMAVANALSDCGGNIDDEKCVEISYPSFWELFE